MPDPVDPGAPIPATDRKAAGRAAMRRCLDYQRLRPVDVAVLVGTAFGALVIGTVINRALAAVGIPASGWSFGLGSLIFWMGLWALVYDRRYTRLFREELRARGHNVCLECGYFLGDVRVGNPCPECGATVVSASEGGP